MNNPLPLLTMKQLSTSFRQGSSVIEAVKNVSLTLNRGETLAIVGESGSGKSVTAHAILGLLPYPTAFHPSGEIIFDKLSLLPLKEKEKQTIRGNRIGIIFQEPLTALNPLHKIEKQIAETIALHQGLNQQKTRKKIIELLNKVQINQPETLLQAYPHQLSGGQRQRVIIAMAIANSPDLLIADEPTTALDVSVQQEIITLLKDLQKNTGMAILLITHDFDVVKKMAHHTAVMHEGVIIETGETQVLLKHAREAYTKKLIDAEPKGIAKPISDDSEIILTTDNLAVHHPLAKQWFFQKAPVFTALEKACIHIRKGETLGIVGESGSGKSTLAKAVLKLQASEGEIYFRDQSIQGLSEKAMRPLRPKLQIVFQDPFASLSPRFSIADIIAEGVKAHRKLDKTSLEKLVIDTLREVQLPIEIRHRYPHECSGGQRQRVAIARAIIMQPELIILDEPTSALDRSVQIGILALLKELQLKRQLSYLFISHDLKVIRSISHRIAVMHKGKIVEQDKTETLFTQAQHPYTKKLLKAQL